MKLVRKEGFMLVNMDSVIMAEKPKLSPYIEQMKGNIAKTLGVRKTK